MSKERLLFCGKTDMGRQRTNNEDAFVSELLDDHTVLAVAIDGVGGYEGGEVAAEIAQREIPAYLKEFNRGERMELLKQAVVDANNAIYERRQTDTARANMSCVLTSALIDTERKVVDMVHVGDTRLYQFHHGKLVKLSHDHSLIGYREEMGDLTEEQAMHHPQRNVISRDVGSARHEVGDLDFLETEEFPLLPNSTFLLCSDGLTDLITSKQIVVILGQVISLEEKAQMLIDAANEAGGKDNVTVVLVEYQAEEKAVDDVTKQESEGTITNEKAISPLQDIPDKEKHRIKPIVAIIIFVLLLGVGAYLLLFFHTKQNDTVVSEQPIKNSLPYADGSIPDVPVGVFNYMYDTTTSHPWSSFLSLDSNYVLRLERVFKDSLGTAYRALVYERTRFYKGTWICTPLSVPSYIGYGTAYYPSQYRVEMTFENGNTDSDGTTLRLTGDYQWDSVITAINIPFESEGLSDSIIFVKYPWEKLKTWWVNPMCR